MPLDREAEKVLVTFAKDNEILSILQERYAQFEQDKEVTIAKKIIQDPSIAWIDLYPLPEKFLPIVSEEIDELAVNNSSRIAICGAGSFPATAISMSEKFPAARITCIDRNRYYCQLARTMTHRLGFRNIGVVCESAEHFDYSNFTHVLVTLITDNKAPILDAIFSQSKSRALLRSATGIVELIYPHTPKESVQRWCHKKVLTHGGYLLYRDSQ